MRTIGLDVHRRFAEIAILQGKEEHQLRISTEPQALRDFARTLGPDDQVVLEATANTWPIADLLAERAGRVVVSNPLRTKAIADAKIKTDKVDARTLAQLLAADFIPQVWVPDPETRVLRGRIARRRSLVQQRTRLRNQIHAALIRSLVHCPQSDLFGRAGRRWLAQVTLASHERAGVESALRLHDGFEAEIAQLDRELTKSALASPDAQLLCTINGIGAVTALALCALIGPIERFGRPAHISRAGQAHARGLLVEAAHDAVRSPGPLAAFHARIADRRGPAIAAVAVARKLAVIVWHLLSDRSAYRFAAPTRLAEKRRRMELAAGAARARSRTMASRPRAERLRAERAELEQAERAYRALVRERSRTKKKRDAAAATGVRP